MTKKIKVILTCFKQTSYEDYTHYYVEYEIIPDGGTDKKIKAAGSAGRKDSKRI